MHERPRTRRRDFLKKIHSGGRHDRLPFGTEGKGRMRMETGMDGREGGRLSFHGPGPRSGMRTDGSSGAPSEEAIFVQFGKNGDDIVFYGRFG